MSLPHSKKKSRVSFFERQDIEPDENPDGQYWRLGVQSLQQQLTDVIGKEKYEAFAEMVWPGEAIDGKTWQEVYGQLDLALDLAWNNAERDVMKLADAAEGGNHGAV